MALTQIVERWRHVMLSISPADREEARRAIQVAYASAGLETPQHIEWVASPWAGAHADACLFALCNADPDAPGEPYESDIDRTWVECRSRAETRFTASGIDAIFDEFITRLPSSISQMVFEQLCADLPSDLIWSAGE